MKTSEMVFNYLKQQGLIPEFDERNNIHFKYQMCSFLFFNEDNDQAYIHLTLPWIYDVAEDNRLAVLEAINEVNTTIKVVKLFLHDNSVWCSTEIVMGSNPELDDFIPRLLNILLAAQEEFYKKID
jgi:hypothetical protein